MVCLDVFSCLKIFNFFLKKVEKSKIVLIIGNTRDFLLMIIKNPVIYKLSKNKYLEFYSFKNYDSIYYFNLSFSLSRKTDHAGLNLELDLFGYIICLDIYDSRHWDSSEGKWI